MKMFAIIVGVALLVSAAVYYKVSVWNECRETNSGIYCWQLISK